MLGPLSAFTNSALKFIQNNAGKVTTGVGLNAIAAYKAVPKGWEKTKALTASAGLGTLGLYASNLMGWNRYAKAAVTGLGIVAPFVAPWLKKTIEPLLIKTEEEHEARRKVALDEALSKANFGDATYILHPCKELENPADRQSSLHPLPSVWN